MEYIPAVQKKEIEHLKALQEIAFFLNFKLSFKELSEKVLSVVISTLQVETATIYISDPEQKQLKCLTSVGKHKEVIIKREESLEHKLGFGLIGWIAQMGTAEILNEPQKNSYYSKEADSLIGITAKNILCVPIVYKNKNYGVIEVINKKSDFDELDKEFLATVTGNIAMTLENSELYQEMIYSKEYVENIIESIPGGFIATDKEGKITVFNSQAQNILGINKSSAVGKNAKDVFINQSEIPSILFDAFMKQQIQNRQEVFLIVKTDKRILIGYGTILIKNKFGKLAGSGMIFQDITEFAK